MDDPTDTPVDRHETERRAHRRLIGIILFPIAFFPLLSMMTYNWRDISMLNAPPLSPPANLIGLAGAWSVFAGYTIFGLALWVVPVFVLLFSAILLYGKIRRTWKILLWTPVFLVALCCLVQLGSETVFALWLERLNLVDAGGAIGFYLMTRLLAKWFSPVGAGILTASVMLFAAVMAVGIRNTAAELGRLTGWWSMRQQTRKQRSAEEAEAEAQAAAAKRDEELLERARRASEEAKRVREEERKAKAAAARPPKEPPARKPPAPPARDDAPDLSGYPLPPVSLLNPATGPAADHGNIREIADILVETLSHYKIPVEVVGAISGPVVTQYELRPAPHIKLGSIKSLQGNLQMALEAKTIRIEAPIPGKNAVGIEIPNRRARAVTFREILEGPAWEGNTCAIPLVLGKDVAGNDIVYDLTKAPHLLVAGATGAGKSVCLNAIMTGFLMSRSPEDLRLILVDPKRVEFTAFNDLPHLLVPVINEPKRVAFGLRWALIEMDKRYKLLNKVGCRNIAAFNARLMQGDLFGTEPAEEFSEAIPAKLPYIVIVMDEVADIMAAVGKEVEPAIARLTALSRAVGIHLIIATQRPSVDVITGTIKANIPGRIAFKVSQANDSRTILDNPGAEDLIGKGDMLFLREGSLLQRAQGAWVSDDEINRVVEFVKQHTRPCYDQALVNKLDRIKEAPPEDDLDDGGGDDSPGAPAPSRADADDDSDDAMVIKALEVIRMTRRAAASLLQRRLRIGYNRAARLMDILEERGIVGPQVTAGSGAREILVDLDAFLASANYGDAASATPPGLPEDDSDIPEED
ncbi:MAG: DNA translocase FtsK 4TM domain-containing protein [Kiritimatiellaeota bacterium]|nr:DNA translocase FtsK 4TM domain-containing protein [Kiritimatiellota bacterium]